MKAILETTEELLVEARKIARPSTYVTSIISALGAVKDNATWELERLAKQAAAAAPQPAGGRAAAPAPKGNATPSPVRE